MSLPSLVLAAVAAGLYAAGLYLVMQRPLLRILLGFILLGHAANIALLLAGGAAGAPPLLPLPGAGEPVADPLPQAMALTAIVITFGTTAFALALAYRAWRATGQDQVRDDVEDRRLAGDEPPGGSR
ncbi:Na(+)/H(+) antiporter subunit C [Plantactinospora sp. WMMC1484]|uniref:Na(+)/H(+) antiporter subunit C n=1 Tax=Plantactinospora sp. WMMC1484 TaxID=3404122 RepID=UPI003BF52BE4